MIRFLLVWMCVLPLLAAEVKLSQDVERLLKAVEQRYNRARTLEAGFEETYKVLGRGQRTESGELSLRKPGKMRWDYRDPAGKVFISDGKYVYYYNPAANRAEKTRLKETEDMRAPLAFLLGKLDFDKEFHNFLVTTEGRDTVVRAEPKSGRLPYRQVEFVITPDYQIREVSIAGQDSSILSFIFTNERINTAVSDQSFRLQLPAGVPLVETAGMDENR